MASLWLESEVGMNKDPEIIEWEVEGDETDVFIDFKLILQLKSSFIKMLNSVLLFPFRYCTLSLAMLKSEWPVFTIFERTERNSKR